MMDMQMIKEMAEDIDFACVDLSKDTMLEVARALTILNYRKIPEDSVVLSKEEYEMRIIQCKNLEIKYSNLSDNYKLCKDANETIKQSAVIARKEAVKEFAEKLKDKAYKKQLFYRSYSEK